MRKIWKKVLAACIWIFFIILSAVDASAEQYTEVSDYWDAIEDEKQVYDFADLLTESEEKSISAEIKKAVKASKLDIVILTIDDNFGESQRNLADYFYNMGKFGYEDDMEYGSGVLLLVDMMDRQIYISTAGIGIFYINDGMIEYILDDIVEDATDGNYKKLCNEFLEDVVYYSSMVQATPEYKEVIEDWYSGKYDDYEKFENENRSEMNDFQNLSFNYNRNGVITKDRNIDVYNMSYSGFREENFFTTFRNIGIDLLIGAVVAFIVVICLRNPQGKQMTVGNRTYRTTQKTELLRKEDIFIRRTTTSRRIESSSGSSGGRSSGGGGSHHRSGGHSHGGGGRGF